MDQEAGRYLQQIENIIVSVRISEMYYAKILINPPLETDLVLGGLESKLARSGTDGLIDSNT